MKAWFHDFIWVLSKEKTIRDIRLEVQVISANLTYRNDLIETWYVEILDYDARVIMENWIAGFNGF